MNSLLFPQTPLDRERLELKEKLKHHFDYVISSIKTPLPKDQLAKWACRSFFSSHPYPKEKRNDSYFIQTLEDIIANDLGYNLQVKGSIQKTSLNDIEKRKWQVYVEIYIPHFVKDQMEATPELGNKQQLARDAYKFMLDYIPPEVQADPDFEVIVNKVRDDLQEEYGDFLSEDFIIPDAPRTEEAIEPTNDPNDDNEGAQLVNEDGEVINERFDEQKEDDSLKFNDIYQNTDSSADVKEEMINEYLDDLHNAMNSGDARKIEQIKKKIEELQSLSSLKLDWDVFESIDKAVDGYDNFWRKIYKDYDKKENKWPGTNHSTPYDYVGWVLEYIGPNSLKNKYCIILNVENETNEEWVVKYIFASSITNETTNKSIDVNNESLVERIKWFEEMNRVSHGVYKGSTFHISKDYPFLSQFKPLFHSQLLNERNSSLKLDWRDVPVFESPISAEELLQIRENDSVGYSILVEKVAKYLFEMYPKYFNPFWGAFVPLKYFNTSAFREIPRDQYQEYVDDVIKAYYKLRKEHKRKNKPQELSDFNRFNSLKLDWANVGDAWEELDNLNPNDKVIYLSEVGGHWQAITATADEGIDKFDRMLRDHKSIAFGSYNTARANLINFLNDNPDYHYIRSWDEEQYKKQKNASLKFSVFNNMEGEQNETNNIGENAQKAQNTENTYGQTSQAPNEEARQSPQKTQLDIYYLAAENIIDAHDDILKKYGGAPGLFEGGYEKLEAAIGRMQSAFGDQEFYPSIFEKAAVLMHSIITTHPFVDGNKRTAYMAALTFLHYNDFTIDESEELADIIIQVASDTANYDHLLACISKNAQHILDSHAISFNKLTSLKLDWSQNLNRYELSLNFAIEVRKLVDIYGEEDEDKVKKYANRFLKKIQNAMVSANKGYMLLLEKMYYEWDSSNINHASALFSWGMQGTELELRKLVKLLKAAEPYFIPYQEEDELADEFTDENVIL